MSLFILIQKIVPKEDIINVRMFRFGYGEKDGMTLMTDMVIKGIWINMVDKVLISRAKDFEFHCKSGKISR